MKRKYVTGKGWLPVTPELMDAEEIKQQNLKLYRLTAKAFSYLNELIAHLEGRGEAGDIDMLKQASAVAHTKFDTVEKILWPDDAQPKPEEES